MYSPVDSGHKGIFELTWDVKFLNTHCMNVTDYFVHPPVDEVFESMITTHGVQASNWAAFKYAVFGRDSIRFARDTLPFRSDVARVVITTLASLQATLAEEDNRLLDAEVGKIHHEARWKVFDGVMVTGEQARIFDGLAQKWGTMKNGELVVYYGSDDATPDFVQLVTEYTERYGKELLDVEVMHEIHGHPLTIREALTQAIHWIENRLRVSALGGFIETVRKNPAGIGFQTWRDSSIGYFLPSGEVANKYGPVASLEIQAKCYDALKCAMRIVARTREERAHFEQLAHDLRARVLKKYWLESEQFFAMALDQNPKNGETRVIETISSVPFELLETTFFDNLPECEYRRYTSVLIEKLFGDEFLTDVGIRCVARQYEDVFAYWPYHGPNAVWPMHTNVIAIGLRQHGFERLATELENRLIESVNRTGYFTELLYVDSDGFVDFDLHGEREIPRQAKAVTNIPEKDQAWTVSAVMRVLKHRYTKQVSDDNWVKHCESTILTRINSYSPSTNLEELQQKKSQNNGFSLDVEQGGRLEWEHLEKFRLLTSST